MRNIFFLLGLLFISGKAFCQDSQYLLKLEESEKLWNLQGFSSYSYMLKSGGAFGYTLYRITYKNGKCTAKSKTGHANFLQAWETDNCKMHTMPELFLEFKRQLNFGTESVSAEFDPEFGYIKSLSLEPKTDLTDQTWYIEVTKFKAKK